MFHDAQQKITFHQMFYAQIMAAADNEKVDKGVRKLSNLETPDSDLWT